MNCALCGRAIPNYDPEFHRLKMLDDAHALDICPACIERFEQWRGETYAKLFPTKAMKKRFGENR